MKMWVLRLVLAMNCVVVLCANSELQSNENREKIETDAEVKYHLSSSSGFYYEQFGPGYNDNDTKIVRLDLDSPITRTAQFLAFLVFPEIKINYPFKENSKYNLKSHGWSEETWRMRDSFITMPYLNGLKVRLNNFLNDIDRVEKKNINVDDAELESKNQILKSLGKVTTYTIARLLSTDSIYDFHTLEIKSSHKEFYNDLKKTDIELSQILNAKFDDNKLLSLIYLIKGWIRHIFENHKEAVEMFDRVIEYNIEDYALSASFYKAMSVGALKERKGRNVFSVYKNLLSFYGLRRHGRIADRSGLNDTETHIKLLSQSDDAKNIYSDILEKYKHLEKDRRVIFLWCKEILDGKPAHRMKLPSQSEKSNVKPK